MSLASFVRRADPDRYFCALFAPSEHRETLFTLYAFNHELARACEITREPALALIRLQWWREVVEGQAKPHEVAGPLRAAIQAGLLPRDDLLALIEARECEAEGGLEDLAAWTAWLRAGAGGLMRAAGAVLGAPVQAWPRLTDLGAGYGAAGQRRNLAARGGQGDGALPEATAMAQAGLALLGARKPCARDWISAVLPAELARRDLLHLDPSAHPRGVGDRFAILRAYLRGTC